MVSHRKGLILGVVSANRLCGDSELREGRATCRTIWEISVTVSMLILLISSFSTENILPGRNFNICNNVGVFFYYSLFLKVLHILMALQGEKIFLLLFKKIYYYIIKLSLSQPRKHTISAAELRI